MRVARFTKLICGTYPKATIDYFEADVPVTDDRGTVKGHNVVITIPTESRYPIVRGQIIPPEGHSPDCWIEPPLIKEIRLTDLDEDLINALANHETEVP